MARGNDRHSRPTHPVDVQRLAKLAEEATPEPDAEVFFEDLDDKPPPPQSSMSRAVTLHDPLTTSLLAEVARRTRTVELDPEEVDEAKQAEPEATPKTKRR